MTTAETARGRELDQLEVLFLGHFQATDRDLRACLALVRDAVLYGTGRARARATRIAGKGKWQQHTRGDLMVLVGAHDALLSRVAIAHGVQVSQLIGHDRTKTASLARAEAMWALRARGLSYPEIGAVVGGRHHTSAVNAARKTEKRIARDPGLGERLRRLAIEDGHAAAVEMRVARQARADQDDGRAAA